MNEMMILSRMSNEDNNGVAFCIPQIGKIFLFWHHQQKQSNQTAYELSVGGVN